MDARQDGVGKSKSIAPEMQAVTGSTNIAAIGHDGDGLWVRFMNKTLYRFPTAGGEHVDKLLKAPSPGQYFAEHVRRAHKGERVNETALAA